ncbi:hypothetical protein Tco_0345650 [Tanacetum coccineum]
MQPQRPQRKEDNTVSRKTNTHVNMDDPNITMEEYIRLEEEKARRRGKVYNWKTATYSKICSLNDEINFRISIDESDDEDYTNEFPAIVYNDALTSKSDFSTEPTLCPQHIDKFNLIDETSLSECYEVEQNVLYFNDLFPFNVIYPNDSKSNKDNGDDKIDIKHFSGDLSVKPLPDVSIRRILGYGYGVSTSYTVLGPREDLFSENFMQDLVKGNRRILVDNLQIWRS